MHIEASREHRIHYLIAQKLHHLIAIITNDQDFLKYNWHENAKYTEEKSKTKYI